MQSIQPFTLAEIDATLARLAPHLLRTPVMQLDSERVTSALGSQTQVTLKLELFQRTGSFKPRGALINIFALSAEELARGITAVSAGNHAIAAAFAAHVAGASAKVVMIETANPLRIARAKQYGAEVVLAADAHRAFALAENIVKQEGRSMLHPFEGRNTALGTSTLGIEFLSQTPHLEAVVVPIGGGGLCAGVSAAVKLKNPACRVYGVEPEGADTMRRSFAAGSPQSIERVASIADSLGAPYAMPITYSLCRQHVDALVTVSDDMMREAMRLLLEDAKLAVEPAGAAATAAMLGPLRERLAGKRVGLIVCGANIDAASFARLIN